MRGSSKSYKFAKNGENKLQICNIGFLESDKRLPDFCHSFLQVAEFFAGDFGRFFLEAELVGCRAVDQVSMFEYVGCVLVHSTGFN